MLFKLSLKNIQRSIKNYAIYFFTLILGVAIFYVFNSLESQTVMLNVSGSTEEIIKMMTQILSLTSIFVAFILAFLIIYANKFLIKRRNKEFAIYITLGMSKRKISLLLFIETLLIGIISLVLGLGFGVLISQFTSVFVANMFKADMSEFKFVFSQTACIKTLINFSAMYFVVMIFNTFNISKNKLINLLNANKRSENIKLKNPTLCTIIFILSAITLGYCYYTVTKGYELITSINFLLFIIVLGCISTFFIFWSLSGLILKIIMSFKKTYYKGLNSFILRQISSQINTAVLSMTIISLMLFITITLLSSSLALNNSLTKDLEYLTPVDVVISKQMADYYELDQLPDKVREDLNYSTMETLTRAGINPDVQFKDLIEITIYGDESLTLRTSLGNTLSKFLKKYPYVMLDLKEQIVRLSDYNKIAALYGHQQLSLKNDEYIILADFKPLIPYRNETLKSGNTIEVNDNILKPAKEEIVEGFIHMAGNKVNRGIFIVPDKVVANTTSSNSILIANYKNNKAETEEFFNEYYTKNYFITTLAVVNTKIDIMASSIGLGAMVTFIGLYIGIIFMISSAAILALKELSESTDNKERFNILRKIGADEKMINKALFKQIGIFFIFPLLIAIIHSIFGITFAINILETFGNDGLFESIIMTALLLIFIYGGYFIITYFSSKSMMRD